MRFVFCALLTGTLSGCAVYTEHPRRGAYVAPATVGTLVIVEDDYYYYPDHEVYYSNKRHQCLYLDNGVWVTRQAPRVGDHRKRPKSDHGGPGHGILDLLIYSKSI